MSLPTIKLKSFGPLIFTKYQLVMNKAMIMIPYIISKQLLVNVTMWWNLLLSISLFVFINKTFYLCSCQHIEKIFVDLFSNVHIHLYCLILQWFFKFKMFIYYWLQIIFNYVMHLFRERLLKFLFSFNFPSNLPQYCIWSVWLFILNKMLF